MIRVVATARLYLDDPLLASFEATVIAHAHHHGRASLVLDRSAFYPESGGQMADRGTLAGLVVRDVQVDGDVETRRHHALARSHRSRRFRRASRRCARLA
jgi:alanyl-tRNA synthetase